MVDIIIFGVGVSYKERKRLFLNNTDRINIVGFLDNNANIQQEKIDGKIVYAPEFICELKYDAVVILSKKYMQEMTDQLLKLGVEAKNIWNLNKLMEFALKGKRTLYGNYYRWDLNKSKILIITAEMGFHGGAMAALFAAIALRNKGYEVMLSAPDVDETFLEEAINEGIDIAVWDCLPHIYEEDKEWICQFDAVIVNVFPMINCAYEISKIRPTIWWIHEAVKGIYQLIQTENHSINTASWMNRLSVIGVSSIAKDAFNEFYPFVIEKTLPFGIPDKAYNSVKNIIDKSKIIFAVIGLFSELKGQKVLVEALARLSNQEKEKIEVWFIGPQGTNKDELAKICEGEDCIKVLGEIKHEKLMKLFSQIDVVVCSSLIETMSMTIIEGMMFGKICITTDMTGIAEYIENGKNGFVIRNNDSVELAKRMSWIVNNINKCEIIKEAARNTYERMFTLDKFGENMKFHIEKCIKKYEKSYTESYVKFKDGNKNEES